MSKQNLFLMFDSRPVANLKMLKAELMKGIRSAYLESNGVEPFHEWIWKISTLNADVTRAVVEFDLNNVTVEDLVELLSATDLDVVGVEVQVREE